MVARPFIKAQFAFAMLSGILGPINPATEAKTERGVGAFGKTARWYQAR